MGCRRLKPRVCSELKAGDIGTKFVFKIMREEGLPKEKVWSKRNK